MITKFFSWLHSWFDKFREDLQPAPGRLATSLRILLSVIITLILLLIWQLPLASLGLYVVFIVGRDSPSVSLRSAVFAFLTLVMAVALDLGIVILTDNDPMARVLSVAVVGFIGGMLVVATNVPALGSTFGLVFGIVIALWENHAPSDYLVKYSLYLLATISTSLAVSVAVEYVFGDRDPVDKLQEERRTRYEALEAMFRAYAQGAGQAELNKAWVRVSRLAGTGQSGMQALYNTIVDRNLDPGTLPIGSRVRITMLAQLMDVSAAFGAQQEATEDPEIRERCARIAEGCHAEIAMVSHGPAFLLHQPLRINLTLLDRVEETLQTLLSMPIGAGDPSDKQLVALPSKELSLVIPGALKDKATIAFGLKISLCATLCYIIYHAVDWPGISTCVTTVFITGL